VLFLMFGCAIHCISPVVRLHDNDFCPPFCVQLFTRLLDFQREERSNGVLSAVLGQIQGSSECFIVSSLTGELCTSFLK